MIKSITKNPLYPIANPKSIAFFGASNNLMVMGSFILDSLLDFGYDGAVYPVHLKEPVVQNLKAYRSVADLPEIPDLAVIVVPTKVASQILEECGRKGIRHAVMVTAGFNEVGGEGVRMGRELVEIANRYGIRFLGPNCIGVTNPYIRLNSTALKFEGRPGFIGMASQSGSFVTQMFNYLRRYGLGFSTAFSVGNEANVDIVDCMEYFAACPHTRVITLYIEGIRRGEAFVKTARAIVPHKPIVAFYVGGTETGRRAGLSHTGAMAGPDPIYDGIFQQSGVIRASSIIEMFDFCWTLGALPEAAGTNVAVQTHSGGPGAIAADACGRAGLDLPLFSAETLTGLKEYIPHTGSIGNPVDITFSKDPQSFWYNIPNLLLQDRNVDILMMYFLEAIEMMERHMTRFMGWSPEKAREEGLRIIGAQADAIASLMKHHGKPIVGYTFRSLEEPFIQELYRRGIPVFPGPERAVRALEAMIRYKAIRAEMLSGDEREENGDSSSQVATGRYGRQVSVNL
ncbi:MAG: CoA-binding protein [Deltaproteobacteria bacterium]|nr:CoA-binding protein [Deltaproteobacteria bacterium]